MSFLYQNIKNNNINFKMMNYKMILKMMPIQKVNNNIILRWKLRGWLNYLFRQ